MNFRDEHTNIDFAIRPYHPDDAIEVADLWYRAGKAAYTFIPLWQSFSLELAREVFVRDIAARFQIWVGLESEKIVAYLAMNGSCMERLYVDPEYQRRGWGKRLFKLATEISPTGFTLFTHQENWPARALYEKLGCKVLQYGISPPPENIPDIEYEWRP